MGTATLQQLYRLPIVDPAVGRMSMSQEPEACPSPAKTFESFSQPSQPHRDSLPESLFCETCTRDNPHYLLATHLAARLARLTPSHNTLIAPTQLIEARSHWFWESSSTESHLPDAILNPISPRERSDVNLGSVRKSGATPPLVGNVEGRVGELWLVVSPL